MKVIDNFLSSYQFKIVESAMMSPDFPWYFTDGITTIPEPQRYQFIHGFYSSPFIPPYIHIKSDRFFLLDLILQKLDVKKLTRIKANLNPRTLFNIKSGYHYDYKDIMTAVYYINTNNGWTQFKKGGKVKSVANRMVIFDSNLEHQGVTCTDEKRRVVINFNYEV